MGTSSGGREAVVKTGDIVEGRYRIIKTLGEGGMGTVFLAEHALIKRRVAIKVLHPELATDVNVIERFMNEARAAGTLGHPNIVESTDMGFTHNHVPYIVFEYLEGTLLTDEIYRVGGLPVRRALRIATQIASALDAAHVAGIVHRDLKSDNIFLTDKEDVLDHVKVLDFGISRFMSADDRQRGVVVGTPEFMAPEQISDPDNVDRRADVYALGVILYEMLTARRPFSNDEDPRQLLHRIVNEPPPPLMRPEVPHGLEQMILTKLLSKNPDRRYQEMVDVEAALENFVTVGDGTPISRPVRKRTEPGTQDEFAGTESTLASVPSIVDLARNSNTIPRPVMANTPFPGVDTLDNPAIDPVSLPYTHKRPYVLYGIAAAGILIGGVGLAVGLRGSSGDAEVKTAAVSQQPTLPAATTPVPREIEKIQVQLESDAPSSHVVFRRRVTATPATMQIPATEVVELVEVSAPGYKTERFWLTFDRATHLKAHLVKGTGLVEASEEETLIALGEVTAPTTPQVAAAAAPAPVAAPAAAPTAAARPTTTQVAVASQAKTVERPPATPAPRKIGRAAAETTETKVATADSPKSMTDTSTRVEPGKTEPSERKTEPSKTEPVKTEPAPIAKADPKPEPTPEPKLEPKTEPVKTEVVEAVAKPSIDSATVSSVVGSHRPEVIKCYTEGKKKDHTMKGTLSLQLQVDTSGKVHRVQVQSTLNNPLVAACVVKAANAWKFPARASGDVATVTYPFNFN